MEKVMESHHDGLSKVQKSMILCSNLILYHTVRVHTRIT